MSLHGILKEKTRLQHSQIEKVSLFNKIINKTITLIEYQLLIKKLYGFIAPCENIIHQLPHRYLLTGREKTTILKNDLLALGIEKPLVDQIQKSTSLPTLTNHYQVLGYMYVMEGSTLGGQVITEFIRDTLKLTIETGISYFNGYGKNTKIKWAEFCQILDSKNETNEVSEIILAANETYSTLHDWILSE